MVHKDELFFLSGNKITVLSKKESVTANSLKQAVSQ